jgi:hypothetical protein
MFISAYNNNNHGPTRKQRNYQQLLLREAEAFLQAANPCHRNRGPIYHEDDPQLQKRSRMIKNNVFL